MLEQTHVVLIRQRGVDHHDLKGGIRQRVERPFERGYGPGVEPWQAADRRARGVFRDLHPRMIEHQLGERQTAMKEERAVAEDRADIVERCDLAPVGRHPGMFEHHHETGAEAHPRARDANRKTGAVVDSRQGEFRDFAFVADH